jgi:hypothetical protein
MFQGCRQASRAKPSNAQCKKGLTGPGSFDTKQDANIMVEKELCGFCHRQIYFYDAGTSWFKRMDAGIDASTIGESVTLGSLFSPSVSSSCS